MGNLESHEARLDKHSQILDVHTGQMASHGERIAMLEADNATIKKFMWLIIGLSFTNIGVIVISAIVLTKLK